MKLRLDSHVDTLHEFARRDIQDFNLNHDQGLKIDIPKLREGGVNALFFALFTKQEWGVEGGRERIAWLLDIFESMLKESEGQLAPCLTPKDIYEVTNDKLNNFPISISLGIENGIVIGEGFGWLKWYFDRGIRYLTLCHNFSNQICDSSTDAPIHNGLSEFGKKLIPEMNKIGMMIDVSHASDKTVEDVLEISEKPIIASHSNCRAMCDNPRNLSDYLAEKITEKGGVIQITALPKCVGGTQHIMSLITHINHMVVRFGINTVGIGTDFDGGARLTGFEDISKASDLTRLLQNNHGYSDEDIDKIWGLNFMRVYEANFSS